MQREFVEDDVGKRLSEQDKVFRRHWDEVVVLCALLGYRIEGISFGLGYYAIFLDDGKNSYVLKVWTDNGHITELWLTGRSGSKVISSSDGHWGMELFFNELKELL